MIQRFEHPDEAQAWCGEQREAGRTIGFVPTMGALHDGHLELARRACAENDVACVSVFVNPLQFDDPGDLSAYPRDFERDVEMLAGIGTAMVFTGTLATFFPGQLDAEGRLPVGNHLDPGPAADGLEGEYRKGHFAGVATIVGRLFEVVEPTRAYFGEKDFQQCLVVQEVARRRGEPEVVVCPTVREASGLARSSRNERLSSEERGRAAVLQRALAAARDRWRAGERDAESLSLVMHGLFQGAGVEVEYAEVRDPEGWTGARPVHPLERAQALVAARVGPVRLIDNLRLDVERGP